MPRCGRPGRRAHAGALAERRVLPADPGGRRMRRVPATITPYPDGPLIARGDIELVDAGGAPIATRRRTVALCRCGLSTIKPFCDGTHKAAGFRTE
ncbi:CDGSH iron-sulfur domain-containing protein [Microbacterium sp. 22242]|uniref:CDGSH iron-sulfur domain-containing protein n=1 Tax=Microbacterium sp. 22242 TaxID=3453896 RepID=UPI003F87D800